MLGHILGVCLVLEEASSKGLPISCSGRQQAVLSVALACYI